MKFEKWLIKLGLKSGMHVLVHSSFRAVRNAFNIISPEKIIQNLQKVLTSDGSLIMPTFTYCFRRTKGDYEIFDSQKSPSKVGALTEVFRQSDAVIRTSSPTHSFALWGKITHEIDHTNTPISPLGKDSVLEWLADKSNSYVFLPGVDFRSLTFGHYLENILPLPWVEKNPWEYMHVESVGVSVNGEQKLIQLPGCSKSFINLENYLLENKIISAFTYKDLSGYLIRSDLLIEHGLAYFKNFPLNVLCPAGTCAACDTRHAWYLKTLTKEIRR